MNTTLSVSDRPRKVDLIVLGPALAAALLSWRLARAGRRVAWLIERPGLIMGTLDLTELPEEVEVLLQEWLAEGIAGVVTADGGWKLDFGLLLPALVEEVTAQDGCWAVVGTWVRGISVIEQRVLGVIAEDSRYDARQIVNAASGERHAAFARMLRHPESFRTDHGASASHSSPSSVEGAWQLNAHVDESTALAMALDLVDYLV